MFLGPKFQKLKWKPCKEMLLRNLVHLEYSSVFLWYMLITIVFKWNKENLKHILIQSFFHLPILSSESCCWQLLCEDDGGSLGSNLRWVSLGSKQQQQQQSVASRQSGGEGRSSWKLISLRVAMLFSHLTTWQLCAFESGQQPVPVKLLCYWHL